MGIFSKRHERTHRAKMHGNGVRDSIPYCFADERMLKGSEQA